MRVIDIGDLAAQHPSAEYCLPEHGILIEATPDELRRLPDLLDREVEIRAAGPNTEENTTTPKGNQ